MPINDPASLCATADSLARRTWDTILAGHAIGISVGEESITDTNLIELHTKHPEVRIKKFSKWEEGKSTGADWEWWFVFPGGDSLCIRVQAKIIKHLDSGPRFTNIDYPDDATRPRQLDMLIESCSRRNAADPRHVNKQRIPLYCFYLASQTVPIPLASEQTASMETCCVDAVSAAAKVWGCSLSHAERVKEQLLTAKLHLSDIVACSVPWGCVLCTVFSARSEANPARVALERLTEVLPGMPQLSALDAIWRERPDYVHVVETDGEWEPGKKLAVPSVSHVAVVDLREPPNQVNPFHQEPS